LGQNFYFQSDNYNTSTAILKSIQSLKFLQPYNTNAVGLYSGNVLNNLWKITQYNSTNTYNIEAVNPINPSYKLITSQYGGGNLQLANDPSYLARWYIEDAYQVGTVINTPRSGYNSPFSNYVGQCTYYAHKRAFDKTGIFITFTGSTYPGAPNWYSATTLTKGRGMKANSIAVFGDDGGGGHVSFVEYIDGNDVYYTEGHSTGADGQLKCKTITSFEAGNPGYTKPITGYIYLNLY